ncbi:Bax inhibitor-1 [Candidatus Phytoplasma solani]|uniref:Bax inhibitor-1/YccA family membrane protein n=1 Tax=Candidatus Phytoplasma solani TaxID=69896 RepID=UPI0032D9B376
MKSNNNNIIKVNRSFEKIHNNFLSFSDTTDYKHQATRKGIAFKTIFLLLITTLTTVVFFSFFKTSKIFEALIQYMYYLLLGLFLMTSGVYLMAMAKPQTTNILACLFSFLEGFIIAIFFYCVDLFFNNLFEIIFIALFGTIAIFCLMAHTYYKGVLKVTNRFRTIMQYCSIALFLSYLVRFFLMIFITSKFEDILYHSLFAIPLSLAVLVFLSMYLAIHFDYTEHMISQGMPEKYEWQVSLAFAATLISIFLRIVSILLRIMGKERK